MMKQFFRDEAGATTVEWVVLVAAVITLSIAFFDTVGENTFTLSETTGTAIGTADTDPSD